MANPIASNKKQDIGSVRHHQRESHDTPDKNSREKLGSRSIFYDPDWNTEGIAPPGFKNIPYSERTFIRKDENVTRQLSGLTDIKAPETNKS